ncbi:MAG: beta-N-acetylhexosaminidase, partial [Planctomycetes bacterium]|nr:beta-N-acetylhexosaminidase [Planctomycetota bacterium]
MIAFLVATAMLFAQEAYAPVKPTIIPRPAQMELGAGSFELKYTMSVLVYSGEPDAREIADYLAGLLGFGFSSQVDVMELDEDRSDVPGIRVTTRGGDRSLGDEGYELRIDLNGMLLRAPTARGLFLGVQTIRQLLPPEFRTKGLGMGKPVFLPVLKIVDKPRYSWRGMLLDCSRYYMSANFVKRYIDLLAFHKMNVFHWHLTDDQGWRIEIKKYPKLTRIGGFRGEETEVYGGYYTQVDVRDVLKRAKSRFVMVVPEIELPGHAGAALAAYPELSCTGGPFKTSTRWGVHKDIFCAGNEKTFEFLEAVLSEVIELFPSEYIHIGGDEVPKDRWKECPKCQARIKSEGLKDEDELQSYFVKRIEKFLNSKGKRLIGWDEILEGGLAPNATVQSWRGMDSAVTAATAGHDVIVSPTSHCYLDYPHVKDAKYPAWMGVTSLEQTYSFEPTPPSLTPEQARHILGAEVNMWTEHAPQKRVDHQVFPRLCALAEVTWTPKELRDWPNFSERMKTHY